MPTKRIRVKSATIRVVKHYGLLPPDSLDQQPDPTVIEVRQFHVEPARVYVERGSSIQVAEGEGQEWQTVRIGIELPCYVEEIDAAKEMAFSLAQEELARQRALIFGAAADEFNLYRPQTMNGQDEVGD